MEPSLHQLQAYSGEDKVSPTPPYKDPSHVPAFRNQSGIDSSYQSLVLSSGPLPEANI